MSRSTSAAPGIAYQPALDGLRAVAVTMVLLFHGGVGWMRGGYFGVSIFFTLSGFLITSLLLREHEAHGRIAPKAFYARRLRRLMPASLLCLTGVCVLGVLDVWTGVDHLRRDALGALFQVANWVQLAAGESYTDLQSRNAGIISPLDHYWSLAIEEQFYWIWPLAFWGLASAARRRRWSLAGLVGVLTIALGMCAPLITAVWGSDAAYWATPARAGEIVLGAWIAVAHASGGIRSRGWMAPVGAVAVVVVAVVLPPAGGIAYHGGFPVLAVATGVLLLGLQQPGPVTAMLAVRPLVALGTISYGVYLYHFPIYVLMSPQRVGQSGTVLLALRVAVTLVVAVVSYRALERPIRFGRASTRRTLVWSGAATAAVCGLAMLVPVGTHLYYQPDTELAAAAAIQPVAASSPEAVVPTTVPRPIGAAPTSTVATSSSVPDTVAPSTTVPALDRPARVLVVGDSTAQAIGAGMVRWAAEHPDLMQVSLDVAPGCGFVRGGEVPSDDGFPFTQYCDEVLNRLPTDLATLQPDVVMLMVTSRDIVPRKWNDDEGVIGPPDRRFVDRLRADYRSLTDLIESTTAAQVVWIRAPATDPYWLGVPAPFTEPELLQLREGVVRDTVDDFPDRSRVLDLRAWMESSGLADDRTARPDGLHFTPEAARDLTDDWLGPQLLVVAAEGAARQSASEAG